MRRHNSKINMLNNKNEQKFKILKKIILLEGVTKRTKMMPPPPFLSLRLSHEL